MGTIAKGEVTRYPILGPWARKAGLHFVDRGNPTSRAAALASFAGDLRKGRKMLLFPEGTTTIGDSLAPLQEGGLKAAFALGVPGLMQALRAGNLVLASGLPLLQVLAMFLAATTYRFFSEEREKRKARERFSRFLAPAIVDEVLQQEGSLRLGGEKRELTALFADIRGFTTISEQLDPHVLLEVLNQYLTPMTDIIVQGHQGTLDKYIGDAIMAFWGAPRPQPDHALRACRAALAMLVELDRLRAGWRAQGLPDIDVGIGLNTGPMSVGFVGSQDRFYNYTILGDAVNRLMDPSRGLIIITHFPRILETIVPHKVHVLSGGRIIKQGGMELAQDLESRGYDWVKDEAAALDAAAGRA